MYIIHSGRGIEFMVGQGEIRVVPPHIFFNLIRKYILDQGDKEDYKYRGGRMHFVVKDECKWYFEYKDWRVKFSAVILNYIINNHPEDFCNKKEYMEYIGFHRFKWSPWNKKK